MKTVFIMRGVSGSGKSTMARTLAGSTGIIHSTDEFFMVNGEYRFDGSKLSEYHKKNFECFVNSLRQGVGVVVCDNVNALRWHYRHYISEAQRFGYQVAFVVMPHPRPEVAAKRNVHGLPQYVIERQIASWEN